MKKTNEVKKVLGNFVNSIVYNNPVCSYSCDRQKRA